MNDGSGAACLESLVEVVLVCLTDVEVAFKSLRRPSSQALDVVRSSCDTEALC